MTKAWNISFRKFWCHKQSHAAWRHRAEPVFKHCLIVGPSDVFRKEKAINLCCWNVAQGCILLPRLFLKNLTMFGTSKIVSTILLLTNQLNKKMRLIIHTIDTRKCLQHFRYFLAEVKTWWKLVALNSQLYWVSSIKKRSLETLFKQNSSLKKQEMNFELPRQRGHVYSNKLRDLNRFPANISREIANTLFLRCYQKLVNTCM